MSKKKTYIFLGSVLGLVVLLVVLSKAGVIGNKDKGTEIEIAKADAITIVETVSATGKIQPEIEVKISSEVSGEIIALPVKEGQIVKKGELLVKINPDLYTSGYNRTVSNLSVSKSGLSQADASFKEAKSNYERSKTLYDKGIISRSDCDKAVASFEVAQANKQSSYYNVQSAGATVKEAKDNLGRTTIYAPADGTISMLNVELGERVLGTQQMTGTEILRVANLNNMEVEVDVNENDIVKINVGDSANVEVDAYLKKEFKGTVTSISNSASAATSADQVTITVRQVNKMPVANAGADQSVIEGSIVSLNGSASYDPDNSSISYSWSAPAGITLSSTTITNPKFTAPNLPTDQNYTISLIVNDGTLNSIADQVIITVRHTNSSPVANAGKNQTVTEGSFVTLDGSASSDPENNLLSYSWSAPNGITLSSTTTVKPTFTAPEVMTDQNYAFSLVVNDGAINSIAEVVVTVTQVNKSPIANAGTDQTVNEGVIVTLDGSASSDPDNNTLTYKWTAPSGITLSSTTVAKPTFTAPEVPTDQSYAFSLIVNDGTINSTADQLFITVRQINKAPVLTSSKSYNVNEDVPQEFLFEGSDAENDPINFSIEKLPSFLHLTKKTNNSAVLSGIFTNQYVGINTFKLNLSDGISTTSETISISVTNVDDAPYVKDSIKNVSVNKGSTDIVIDLKPVFADDDNGDILSFSVGSNTNEKIVIAKIVGTDLTLSFSKEFTGLSQIIIKANSNGKEAQSKFKVEVNFPTGIEPLDDETEALVYPNPTDGDVHIKFEKIPEYGTWINVYNESGRLITKSLIKNDEEILNLNGYVPGIYFIQIAQKKPKTYQIILK